jgi:hypothetical protein
MAHQGVKLPEVTEPWTACNNGTRANLSDSGTLLCFLSHVITASLTEKPIHNFNPLGYDDSWGNCRDYERVILQLPFPSQACVYTPSAVEARFRLRQFVT